MATAIENSSPIERAILTSLSEANRTAVEARKAGAFAEAADAHAAAAEMCSALASIEINATATVEEPA